MLGPSFGIPLILELLNHEYQNLRVSYKYLSHPPHFDVRKGGHLETGENQHTFWSPEGTFYFIQWHLT